MLEKAVPHSLRAFGMANDATQIFLPDCEPIVVKGRRALIYAGDAENVGDLAIAFATHQLLTEAGFDEIAILQWNIPDKVARDEFAQIPLPIISSKSMSAISNSLGSLQIIGGGQMARNNQSIAAIALLLFRVVLGRITFGKVIALGIGVSHLENTVLKLMWTTILRLCHAVCVRDRASFANVTKMGIRPILTGDLVFLENSIFNTNRPTKNSIVVAPCVDPSEGRYVNYQHISALIAAIHKRYPDARLVGALHDERLDRQALIEISEKCEISFEDVYDSGRPADFASLYEKSIITITNRLHSIIFSIKSDAAVICCNDGGKIEAAAIDFGLAQIKAGERDIQKDDALFLVDSAFDRRNSAMQARELAETNRVVLKSVLEGWN